MAVSKRLRFEILRRDNHTCRYCGRSAPEVKLTIDHVVPETLGGSDDPDNLVAACADCNSGKSSVPADAHMVADIARDALRWANAMRQAAAEFSQAVEEHPDVFAAVDAVWYRGNRPDDWCNSIDQFINAGLPIDVIVKMAEVAQNKRGDMGYRWAYFCGCCWTRVRELQERAAEIVGNGQTPPPTPETAAQRLATEWTPDDVNAAVERATAFAEQHLGAGLMENVACRHLDSGCCPDPVCRIEYATTLEWIAIQYSNEDSARDMRAEAVMNEADEAEVL
ncbi:HNH endonuclease [Mycolicibacterium boenickei]|nr:HNH endonuclease [Mycolicibacterium boenickei]